jgi:hypothetical protein
MLHSFSIPRRRRLGVRQLAAAFMPHLIGIERINRAFKEGASKRVHFKGFAADKNYEALGAGAGNHLIGTIPAAPLTFR